LIEIYKAIKRGDLVCIHADRFLEETKTISIPFLGEPAQFALGPFQLVKKLKVPYSFVFAVKESKYGYFFSATKPILPTKNPEEIANDFVSLLEEKVRAYPEQWFNYYNFHK
jgi:predicted LPLAT superfamily acyltransferase